MEKILFMLKIIRILYGHNSSCCGKISFYTSFPEMIHSDQIKSSFLSINFEIFLDASFTFSLQLTKFRGIKEIVLELCGRRIKEEKNDKIIMPNNLWHESWNYFLIL